MLVAGLPHDSATARALGDESFDWTVEAYLLADLYSVWAGESHPARPKDTKKASEELRAKVAALKEQRARIAAARAKQKGN